MRISDWSSDVCSSDLIGEELLARPGLCGRASVTDDAHVSVRELGLGLGPAEAQTSDCCRAVFEEESTRLEESHCVGCSDCLGLPLHELGRALCRQRVRQ